MTRFEFEKYGSVFKNEDFEPQEASEQDVIDGMVSSGCPFAFMIDQINAFTQ